MPHRILYKPGILENLLEQLSALRLRIIDSDEIISLSAIDPEENDSIESILNLKHYLLFRKEDLRPLQEQLATIGLSSLGRSEAHVVDAIERVIHLLHRLTRPDEPPRKFRRKSISIKQGYNILRKNTDRLLGPRPKSRSVRIMVTMPAEAASDYGVALKLAEKGMDVARINCAHDTPEAWLAMIANIRKAAGELGRPICIAADLAGHKIRTGELALDDGVLKASPFRDRFGRVLNPARIRLNFPDSEPDKDGALAMVKQLTLNCDSDKLFKISKGDCLKFTDARGAKRCATIETVDRNGAWAMLAQTSYITNGLKWKIEHAGNNTLEHPISSALCSCEPINYSIPEHQAYQACAKKSELRVKGSFSDIPHSPVRIRLRRTDILQLTRKQSPAEPESLDHEGFPVKPAHIACTLPEVFDVLKVGQEVWIDDGKFGARVKELNQEGAMLEIFSCRPGGSKLLADKGINFPELELPLPGLSEFDLMSLDVLVTKVDIINFSFVETARQMEELIKILKEKNYHNTGVIAKIETARAFHNLTDIALAAMGRIPFGIMIARGDLAMEVGPERLTEVQEEILWLAEAAHLPVVWATQVLETLAKKGVVSRPELTDAAMGERVECVMLNKGPFIEKALTSLDDILKRMQEHQRKKSTRLRALQWGKTRMNRVKDKKEKPVLKPAKARSSEAYPASPG